MPPLSTSTFASAMAAGVSQQTLQELRLCARLADYAYVSGKPVVTDDELEAKWPVGYQRTDRDRDNFYSNSWYRPRGSQHRFFKSHAYVSSLEKNNSANTTDRTTRIVVGFRGTWLQPGEPNEGVMENAKPSFWSRLYNIPFNVFAPSNYGLADIYYDVTLIRVPYRTGVVWKWYSYWGAVILGGSDRFHNVWSAPRKVATGLISRPEGTHVADRGNLLVHLGFWALWASPEGFAGYDRFGKLRKDEGTKDKPVFQGVLQSITKKVRDANGQDVEILVVGHSLGGAVSCFAALDIIAEVDRMGETEAAFRKVKVIHATFGTPPVGTEAFAEHFRATFAQRKDFHRSYAVIHERDGIPKCFAWCESRGASEYRIIRFLRWLGWWSDWSRVGEQLVMRKEVPIDKYGQDSSLATNSLSTLDKVKVGLIGVGAVGFAAFSHLAVPFSWAAVPIFWPMEHYRKQTNPAANWKSNSTWAEENFEMSEEDKKVEHVGIKYHSLGNYITLLEDGHVETL